MSDNAPPQPNNSPALPEWIRPAKPKRPYLEHLAPRLRALGVATVCESARCPNLGECFSCGEATFMLLGEVCSRNCHFCAVTGGRPTPLDPEEPHRIANAVRELGLKYVVLTSVTRDDLADGGAGQFIETIGAIRNLSPSVSVEILIPDFQGDRAAIEAVVEARPDIFAHNVETVPRLYHQVRPQADWERSLEVLRYAKGCAPDLLTKSGFMVGLGERRSEVSQALRELRAAQVDLLTVGQYLQPSQEHLPVVEYLTMAFYDEVAAEAKELGFRGVSAGPLVRSSYHAGQLTESARGPAPA